MPESCMRTLGKMGCGGVLAFLAICEIEDCIFWVNVSLVGWVKHEEGGSLPRCCSRRFTCSNFQPSDMVDTICVNSSSWHCSTRYTCFTGTCGSENMDQGTRTALRDIAKTRIRETMSGNIMYLRCFTVPFPDLVFD